MRFEVEKLEAENELLREMLLVASADIGDWVMIAGKQRNELPYNTACCPTSAGIKRSRKVRKTILDALRGM